MCIRDRIHTGIGLTDRAVSVFLGNGALGVVDRLCSRFLAEGLDIAGLVVDIEALGKEAAAKAIDVYKRQAS